MWYLLLAACTGPGGDHSDRPGGDSGDTDLPEGCDASPATVEVGGGATGFESVEDGLALRMVHGPQGGWHVLASARLDHIDPIVSIHYTIEVEPDGVIVSDNTYRVQIVQDTSCGGYYPGMYGYLNVAALVDGERDTPPELLDGRELVVRMEVSDTAGRVATDSLTGIAARDPIDEESDTGVVE